MIRRRWFWFIVVSAALIIYGRTRPLGGSSSENRDVGIGATGVIANADGDKTNWTCTPTQEALDEVMNWLVRHDDEEARRTSIKTGSIAVRSGQQVKILDQTFSERKIRVLSADDGQTYLWDEQGVFAADPRMGRECWVVREAVSP